MLSLQGGGHVILGGFDNFCPGIPSMCLYGYSVGFWMKHGGRIACKIVRFEINRHERSILGRY